MIVIYQKKHKTIYKIEGFLNIELDALLMIYIYIYIHMYKYIYNI